jgi:hypothetical protein
MPSVETSVWLALKGRVQTLALSPAVPVVYPKENAPAGKHIRVSWLPNTNQRRAVSSSGAHVRPGILQLSLMTMASGPQSTGSADVDMQTAGKIAEHFPADLRMTHGGVTVRVTAAPTVAQAFRDNQYWHTPISVFVETLA